MARLTDKQRAFTDAYLGCLNATEAARRAGYKHPRQMGHETLSKPYIRAEIDRRLEKATMRAEEVLFRLHQHAEGIPPECFTVFGGLIGLDFEKLRDVGLLHLIKKLKYDQEGRPVVEFYDSQNALVHLGKHYALFTERTRIEDWRSDAIAYIRQGEIRYEALADEFGADLATELFAAAGVPVAVGTGAGKNATD